jgi:hypothetical protein
MYCVFCGRPDVTACRRCGRWVCPRHRGRWLSRTVCVGCRRGLARLLAIQAGLAVAAGLLISLIGWWVLGW